MCWSGGRGWRVPIGRSKRCSALASGDSLRNISFGSSFERASPPPFSNLDEIHVWLFDPRECAIDEPQLRELASFILSEGELRDGDSKTTSRDRMNHFLSKMLVRSVLAGYINDGAKDVARDIVFERGMFGKPMLAPAPWNADVRLEFNLSHTASQVALAVSRGSRLGIDLESTARVFRADPSRLARRYFSSEEHDAIFGLQTRNPWLGWNSLEGRERFLHYWTLKESFAKATGLGISRAGLSSVSFSFHPSMGLRANEPATMELNIVGDARGRALHGMVSQSSFFHYQCDNEHIMSLCSAPLDEEADSGARGPGPVIFFRTPHPTLPGHRLATHDVKLLAMTPLPHSR